MGNLESMKRRILEKRNERKSLRTGATGGHFGAVSPQITPCASPNKKSAPQAKFVPQKKVTCPVQLECISSTVPVQNTACAPESVSKISFQEEKHVWTRTLSLRFRAEDIFVLLVFTTEFVGKKRDPHH